MHTTPIPYNPVTDITRTDFYGVPHIVQRLVYDPSTGESVATLFDGSVMKCPMKGTLGEPNGPFFAALEAYYVRQYTRQKQSMRATFTRAG